MAKKESVSVTMRVRVGENELEVTGPSDYVENKIAEFLERQKSIPEARATKTPPTLTDQTSSRSSKKKSVAQFFKQITLKTDVDRALAAGFYLEQINNEENFTAAEIAETIRASKTPPPKNPNDAVNKNIKKGYMMAAGDKDGKMAFVLTTDGEEAIKALLNA